MIWAIVGGVIAALLAIIVPVSIRLGRQKERAKAATKEKEAHEKVDERDRLDGAELFDELFSKDARTPPSSE